MAIFIQSQIFSLQILLVSISALSMAFLLNILLPVILDFIVTQLPQLWNSMNFWLTPPYLYILINGIILTIAASSRFHHQYNHNKIVDDDDDDQNLELLTTPAIKIQSDEKADIDVVMLNNHPVEIINPEFDHDVAAEKKNQVVVSPPNFESFKPKKIYRHPEISDVSEMKPMVINSATDEDVKNFEDYTSKWTLNRGDSTEMPSEYSFSDEKPPVSSRFGHRKTVKSNNEGGKGLRSVTKTKRNDTLENTWKTITEGRSIPLARHLKKSDTWETHNNGSHVSSLSDHLLETGMKKSETFTKNGGGNSVKLRKEPSLSQDELNRRVEAFIKKFNEEMRLQREESLNKYKNVMVTRD